MATSFGTGNGGSVGTDKNMRNKAGPPSSAIDRDRTDRTDRTDRVSSATQAPRSGGAKARPNKPQAHGQKPSTPQNNATGGRRDREHENGATGVKGGRTT